MSADFCHFLGVNPPPGTRQGHGAEDQLTLCRVEEEPIYGSSSAHAPERRTAEGLDDGALYVVEDLDGVGLVHADNMTCGQVESHVDHWGRVTSVDKTPAGGSRGKRLVIDVPARGTDTRS